MSRDSLSMVHFCISNFKIPYSVAEKLVIIILSYFYFRQTSVIKFTINSCHNINKFLKCGVINRAFVVA
jgi:hypothetical protein